MASLRQTKYTSKNWIVPSSANFAVAHDFRRLAAAQDGSGGCGKNDGARHKAGHRPYGRIGLFRVTR